MASKLFKGMALAGLLSTAAACSTESDVTVTFYGYPDNDPPSADIAYDCGRGYTAGGTGTYSDPLTFASASGEFEQCEIIYLPYLKKYLRYEDECAQCTTDYKSGKLHIDIWTGSNSDGGDTQIDCENSLTPDSQSIVLDPASSYTVDSTALFANGKCYTSNTYSGAVASTYCSSSGSGSSSGSSSSSSSGSKPTSTASSGSSSSSCSWSGHCAGATCSTENDCSDDLTCQNGKCA
ncbi:uncharacterized protein BO95DRAFT_372394 [Aspergillus brunneoviolaceus CBS 621.78]|uniref:Chitin-binding type-4 domain-containing protein n=2 Tax=Aspergillus TaxID=5052 RepID=A0A8G1W014_9EURO|nr:hypothetical protein BO95DRAFT_372394 [Aspergillus brunneoviolaceus CBS 621.78]XP_040803390.1 uncharacterized protein BO72DRAFT_505581 [Aspergillus fijiensis CBS 313.89]RAH41747.1 hypothetical protein BO95DRAFT_372394 [Aspergillus brunneoviolaceus CBS 621.78]RAK79380.1 hypothetical protein BO72DRAFT_505581 [Aspergillus fijiensis CBS 313.89]